MTLAEQAYIVLCPTKKQDTELPFQPFDVALCEDWARCSITAALVKLSVSATAYEAAQMTNCHSDKFADISRSRPLGHT